MSLILLITLKAREREREKKKTAQETSHIRVYLRAQHRGVKKVCGALQKVHAQVHTACLSLTLQRPAPLPTAHLIHPTPNPTVGNSS